MLIDSALGPPHGQQPGQDVNEDAPDPGSHSVGLRRAKVDVEYDDRHADAGRRRKQEGQNHKEGTA